MESLSQSCPSCKSSKYNNPQLRLMVNICGHSLCENCVEVLYVRGYGLCVQCKAQIRKGNFRYQLFEDPNVQKEVEIRKTVLNDFNKREEDFETMEEYDKYLELIEDIIYKLVNDVDVDKTKKFIDQYKKDNKESINRNRTKRLSSMEFYDRELEHERILRERREKAEAEDEAAEVLRRKRLLAAKTLQGFISGGAVALPEEKLKPKLPESTSMEPPASAQAMPPSSVLESKHRFLPPPTGSAALQRVTPASFMPLPPTPATRWSGNSNTPSTGGLLTPVSSLVGIQQLQPSTWATSAEHHGVVIPPVRKRPQDAESEDTVVLNKTRIPKSASKSADASSLAPTRTLKEWLEPYKLDLCGPQPPSPETGDVRWRELTSTYLKTVVEPLTASVAVADANTSQKSNPREVMELSNSMEETVEPRVGISHALPRGACGISPEVFLTRALQDSRCGLFL